MLALDARALSKAYGKVHAVQDVTFTIAEGETFGLLGPNGAGKTTTVAMLTTLLAPSAGSARIAGHDVVAEPHEVRTRIGVVFQGPSLDAQLSARQHLRFHARLYHMPRDRALARTDELLRLVELEQRADERVSRLSGGMRRRVEIARALMHRPKVLFLDEPTVGLDPQARRHVWDMLERLQREEGTAVLLTTHHMEEAERLARRVGIMDHGKLLDVAEPAGLKAALGAEVVHLRVAAGQKALAAALARLQGKQGIGAAVWRGDTAEVPVAAADAAVPALLEVVATSGARLASFEVRRPSLEDVFIARTGRALRDAP
ncbi:MAG: ABC transporter ATP-binding protein [Halobacteriales archaeon]|nr:ABC transporter ATP-binding protein [Halobacteriales archaeon]